MDEEYFLVALTKGGWNNTLETKLEHGGVVDRALQNSPALDELITDSLRTGPDNRVYLIPDADRVGRIVIKIATGIYLRHFGQRPRKPLGPVGVYHFSNLPWAMIGAVQAGRRRSEVWPDSVQRALKQAVLDPGGSSGRRRVKWRPWYSIQEGVFEYIFVTQFRPNRSDHCILKFHETLWAAVSIPVPRASTFGTRLPPLRQPM